MSRSAPIDELSRLLGAIEAKLDLVTKIQGEDRSAGASWRTDIRKELSGIRDDLGEVKNKVKEITGKVALMEPEVDDYVEKRTEVRAMSRLAHLGAAMGGGSFALALQWILRKLGI